MEQKQVLEKMASLYKMASEGISRQEFLDSFKNVVAIVTKTNLEMLKRNDDSLAKLTKEMQSLYAEIKTIVAKDAEVLKVELTTKIDRALKEQEQGMKFIYDKVSKIKEGSDGLKGRDGMNGSTPTRSELLALITPLIPQAVNGKDAILDEEAILEKLRARIPAQTTRVGWGAHPLVIAQSGTIKEKVARHINFKGTGVSSVVRNADGTVDVTITAGGAGGATQVYNEVVSGNTQTFTLANTPDTGTLRVYAQGQRLLPTQDYTLAGAIITTVDTWTTGQISADYAFT